MINTCYAVSQFQLAAASEFPEASAPVVLFFCPSVCLSVCPPRISRHSLKTKRWNLQHKQKLIFDQVWIERISVLKLSSRARRDCSPRWLLLAIWTPLKRKLSTGGCLTTSSFVCTTEQRDSSRKKAREGHRSSLHYVQLCSHAHLIMWLAHCKQQLISCRLSIAVLIIPMQLARS